MRSVHLAVGLTALGGAFLVQPVMAAPAHPEVAAVVQQVSPDELRADITTLVGFGTRHTLSDTTSTTRGIGAARAWVKSRFNGFASACNGCLSVETPEDTVSGDRLPKPALIQDVLAIQPGTSDPNRVIIISAHIDSRVSDVMNATNDAPGANDDGSGVAAVLEAARLLSGHRFPATIVYAVTSGEEQGLYGGKLLAKVAAQKGWQVEAVLNNDIIGSSHGSDGQVVDNVVRVFSEGTKDTETKAQATTRKYLGGELDSPSRNLSRFIADVADLYLPDLHARLIYRADRFGRGGDQLPMQEAGYPAVRLTEADENYTRQHQDVRTEGGVAYGDSLAGIDFAYLARVVRLNVASLAILASAPPPPVNLKIAGAVTPDTTLSWTTVPGAAGYRVWWRETSASGWSQSRDAEAATSLTLKGVNIDNFTFGVSAVSADGYDSPVEFPGFAGAFVTGPETGK